MSASHFRRAALALPGAVEGAHQRTADFRVGKRIFATLGYPDDAWGMVKLTQEQQSMLARDKAALISRRINLRTRSSRCYPLLNPNRPL